MLAERQDGVPIVEAATRLGLTPETVRKRLQRGRLAGYKRDNVWLVVLPAEAIKANNVSLDPEQDASGQEQDTGRTPAGPPVADPVPLVEALQQTITILREQLAVKDEQLRQANVLLARLTERPIELAPVSTTVDTPPPAPPEPAPAPAPRPHPRWMFWRR